MFEASATEKRSFMTVGHAKDAVEFDREGGLHRQVIDAFGRAVAEGTPPVAEAHEGLGSVALANAMLMSHFSGRPVDLPLDGDAYERLLGDLIRSSTFRKGDVVREVAVDMKSSFQAR